MRNVALVCFLILVPCSLHAQDKKADWKALYGLRPGEKIELIETGMKKHVGTFSTVTDLHCHRRSDSDARRSKRHRHSQRKRRARDGPRQEPSAPQRSYPWRRRRGSRRGHRRSRIEMFQFGFVQPLRYSTRRRDRSRRAGGAGGRRRHRRRNTQSSHNLSCRAGETEYAPLTECGLARVNSK